MASLHKQCARTSALGSNLEPCTDTTPDTFKLSPGDGRCCHVVLTARDSPSYTSSTRGSVLVLTVQVMLRYLLRLRLVKDAVTCVCICVLQPVMVTLAVAKAIKPVVVRVLGGLIHASDVTWRQRAATRQASLLPSCCKLHSPVGTSLH